ncbi:hypothetical protein ACM26V_13995 [Salipaludibacillus sp. HK11]|uniref:hypothetical protein n=1 Tax=Salipaludibacillus sp. HK11 TaxID=3394320 RepID=UPI0039FC07E1
MTDRKNDNKDEEIQNSGRQTDKQIERVMREWKMEPSEELKRKSLQKAMAGIEEARGQTTKRKRVNQMKKWAKGLSAGVLVAALFFLVLVNFDEFQSFIGSGPDSAGDNDTSENEQVNENDDNVNNEDSNDEEPIEEPDFSEETVTEESDSYPEVDRPDTKEIVTTVEGMEEENTYNLLDDQDMPFTTYIRDNYDYELFDRDYGEGVSIWIPGTEKKFIVVDIVFFDDGIGYDDASQHAEREIEGIDLVDQWEEGDLDELDEWAIESFVHTGEILGRLELGTYENHIFYIHTYYPEEAMDGWYAVQQVIKEEWEWKETGEMLIE